MGFSGDWGAEKQELGMARGQAEEEEPGAAGTNPSQIRGLAGGTCPVEATGTPGEVKRKMDAPNLLTRRPLGLAGNCSTAAVGRDRGAEPCRGSSGQNHAGGSESPFPTPEEPETVTGGLFCWDCSGGL